MKRIIQLTLLLVALLLPATASAQNFYVDGIQYQVNGDGVTVTYNDNSGFVTIPATVSYNGITYSVTAIGKFAFYYNRSGLTGASIPNTVVTIDDYAFGGCSNMTEISIGNSVTSIGREAFCGCSSLTTVTIPDSVTFIGERAFYGCSSLSSIIIPKSVVVIGIFAFYGKMTIYCEVSSKPDRWNKDWCTSDCQVVWGYQGN